MDPDAAAITSPDDAVDGAGRPPSRPGEEGHAGPVAEGGPAGPDGRDEYDGTDERGEPVDGASVASPGVEEGASDDGGPDEQ